MSGEDESWGEIPVTRLAHVTGAFYFDADSMNEFQLL